MMLPYILKRSKKRRKTISLHISADAEIVVSAPYFTKVDEINRFVQEKRNWIQKTIHQAAQLQTRGKKYVAGEEFYYLGRTFPLETLCQQNIPEGLVFWRNRFYLNSPAEATERKSCFIAWYKTKAREYIPAQVDFWGRRLQLSFRSVKITSANAQWGSCSRENNLAFSFRLIMAPPPVIDYVIIHELTHIKEKNHSEKFWKQMQLVMPEYKTHRNWLKDSGAKLSL